MTFLQIQSVSKTYQIHPVLNQISLDVHKGEIFYIMGASGCGKSTLLRIIAGLETPDAGLISLDGRNITSESTNKRGVGFVFQSYCLWPHMNVLENVKFGLDIAGYSETEKKARIVDVLNNTQLTGYEQRFPHELSGGQQQRVALARALSLSPKILLLDEPLSNLDSRLRTSIRKELVSLRKKNDLTMICVSHDFDDILTMADRVAVLEGGKVAQLGNPREIYSNPQTESIARLVGDIIEVPQSIHQRDGRWWTRPEWICISSNGVHVGEVLSISYEGSSALLELTINGSSELVIARISLRDQKYVVGEKVNFQISEASLIQF